MCRSAFWTSSVLLCLGTVACGPPAVTYYKLSIQIPDVASSYTGTNCPTTTVTETDSDLGGNVTVAIYDQPDNVRYLDLGEGLGSLFGFGSSGLDVGLNGTQSGNSYSFSGSWTDNIPSEADGSGGSATPSTTATLTTTVKLTTSGSGLTGTFVIEGKCASSDNMECGEENPLSESTGLSSTNSQNFDCSESIGIVGAVEPAPQQVSESGTETEIL